MARSVFLSSILLAVLVLSVLGLGLSTSLPFPSEMVVVSGPNAEGGSTYAVVEANLSVLITFSNSKVPTTDKLEIGWTNNNWTAGSAYGPTPMTYDKAWGNWTYLIPPQKNGTFIQWYYEDATTSSYYHATKAQGVPNGFGQYNWYLKVIYGQVKPSTYTLTVTESGLPSGTSWNFTLNGTTYSSKNSTLSVPNLASGTYSWTAVAVPIMAGERYGPVNSSGTLTIPTETSLSLTYKPQYLVTLVSANSTEGSVSPSSSWVASGSLISISAVPSYGYVFTGWTSNTTSIVIANASSESTTASVAGPGTLTASFKVSSVPVPPPSKVSVTVTQSGVPSGVSWSILLNGQSYSSTASSLELSLTSGTYTWKAPVISVSESEILEPTPQSGTLSVPSQTSISISYSPEYYLTVKSANFSQGTVSTGLWAKPGSVVNIKATPLAGYEFVSWSSNSSKVVISNSSAASTTVTVNGPGAVTASFKLVPKPAAGMPPAEQAGIVLVVILVLLAAGYYVTKGRSVPTQSSGKQKK